MKTVYPKEPLSFNDWAVYIKETINKINHAKNKKDETI